MFPVGKGFDREGGVLQRPEIMGARDARPSRKDGESHRQSMCSMWFIGMFYFQPGMGRLKSTVNGSTFLWIFKCLMGSGKRKLGVILSTVF